jgi:hypothetical protein
MDVAYAGESVLAAAATTHVQTGLAAVLVLGLGTMGILARAQRRFGVVRVESLFIVAVYVAMLSVLIV